MKSYKIRSKTTGLYSTGGMSPRFNKVGKTWSHIGHVKNHLVQFHKIKDQWYLGDIEVIEAEFKIREVGTKVTDVSEYLK